jgi:DNA-binding transcriptional MocR family regulator
MRYHYQRGRDYMLDWITRYFPEGTRTSCPEGGFLLWLELPENIDAMSLTEQAFEAGIGIAPGELFSTTGKFSHHIRLNYSECPNPKIEAGIKKLGELVMQISQSSG